MVRVKVLKDITKFIAGIEWNVKKGDILEMNEEGNRYTKVLGDTKICLLEGREVEKVSACNE